MKITSVFAIAAFCFAATSAFAQVFMPPAEGFSRQKTAYVTMEDGTEYAGTLERLQRKKGLISAVIITDSVSGKQMTLKPQDVRHMYLPPSGLDKFTRGLDFLNDATKWNRDDLDATRLRKGYVYFEKSEVELKKGKQTLLMQLLNPSFSGKVKVYHDPFAQETSSVGVGGITVAGGEDKSYYVKTGSAPAIRLYKKNYEKEFKRLFGDCQAVMDKYGKKIRWSEIEAAVAAHAACE